MVWSSRETVFKRLIGYDLLTNVQEKQLQSVENLDLGTQSLPRYYQGQRFHYSFWAHLAWYALENAARHYYDVYCKEISHSSTNGHTCGLENMKNGLMTSLRPYLDDRKHCLTPVLGGHAEASHVPFYKFATKPLEESNKPAREQENMVISSRNEPLGVPWIPKKIEKTNVWQVKKR